MAHYECRNGNYRGTGNNCPRFGHHFQVVTAAGLGYHCDISGCGAELMRVIPPGKEHGKKKILFLGKGLSKTFPSSKGRARKNQAKKLSVKKSN
jgi:hypothetical protein